jgi:hypothetical protein
LVLGHPDLFNESRVHHERDCMLPERR